MMKITIALNERSHNVNLLHKILYALGLPVAKKEVTHGEAGQDTLKQVRTLQTQLNVPVDDSVLVDEATSLAIAETLKKRGLTAANRSFTVRGAVRLQNGSVKKRQELIAFDLDLRGVAVYRNVKNIAEIKKNEGFEFLGEAVSDNLGNYRITFYDWQYKQAERKKADVVLYALDGEEIIGRSHIVNSEDYSGKGLVRDLDVIITQKEMGTEYESLMSSLNILLKKSKTSLSEIAKSNDQLVFIAGELDMEQSRINIAASAELLVKKEAEKLSHQLLYGIGRQDIRLTWAVLYKKKREELRGAISRSIEKQIIPEFKEEEITAFLNNLGECTAKHMLEKDETTGSNALNDMLKNALPEEKQRHSFMKALGSFKGSDFREFWNKHLPTQPEFKNNPELISGLLLTQQLTLLTANHQSLVRELQVNRKLTSIHELVELEKSDWLELIKKAGVPDFIKGENNQEKINWYADRMLSLFNVSFPTQRIAKMVEKDELYIEKNTVSKSIGNFLSKNEQFDFASSRIHDFDKEIKATAAKDFDEVRSELMKIQRVFQVSTSPEAMTVLMKNNLHSAYSIANIPCKSFIKKYAKALGGDHVAFTIHQRSSHISYGTEMLTIRIQESSQLYAPEVALDTPERNRVMASLENHIPNYAELFGSPDICECGHCRSVYSPAAYFVTLLRFLKHGTDNIDGHTPFDMLISRRPDLCYLPLTCENTNTIIPYIDLANEVMEYYTAHGSLDNFEGHDTGDTTSDELRANPQNFDIEAYRILSNNKEGKEAVYPFTLPYHQPLDVIRTYSNHLNVSRYEAMKAMNPQPDTATTKAMEAELLGISQEEYIILTGKAFDGTTDSTPLYQYFGYSNASDFNNMQNEKDADGNPRGVRVLLERTGLTYTDLVELIKTQFINPHQVVLDYIESIFKGIDIDRIELYNKLQDVRAGTPLSNEDPIIKALDSRSIPYKIFRERIINDFDKFKAVITLYEPESKCDLGTTKLRTIQSIFESELPSGISYDSWSKIHRFIRLYRKLGWTIHETDIMLCALGEDDITIETISKLASVFLLNRAVKLPLDQLAVVWGNINTHGDKSLYKKLFLNKAVHQINTAFKADTWGNYLYGKQNFLKNYQSVILNAFRMNEEDLAVILEVAEMIDSDGHRRKIKLDSDILNIQNLSTIYRYVVLAKALKRPVTDLCKIIELFGAKPFSIWDMRVADQGEFANINPARTYEFYKLATSIKETGFKPAILEYILRGTHPADFTLGLNKDKILLTARSIRDAFAAIEQQHPEEPESPLTFEILKAKLSLTFQPEIVSQLMRIIEGTASFETHTDENLKVSIPDELTGKYTYIKASGRLTCAGIMSDTEQITLKGLANVTKNFRDAIEELYSAPETFIKQNFSGVFSDLPGTNKTLLNHTAQDDPVPLHDKLTYVYNHFLPLLRSKLRQDILIEHIAALIGLSEEATALLIADNIDSLIADLSTKGFSATYFNDANWNRPVLERIDNKIGFSWGIDSPDPRVLPADNFSVRWKAYIVAPASGDYMLAVEVEEADEAFNLYFDGDLKCHKTTADKAISWEVPVTLNAAQMHLLILEYGEALQNAGVRLYWKTATKAPEIIPASAAYPTSIIHKFSDQVTVYHRAAKFISGFKISETELDHFITFGADFGNINFEALKSNQWKRINDYTTLRNAVPQAQALLTDVFALANKQSPLPEVAELAQMLYLSTAWNKASLEFLVDTHFTLSVDDFKNEIWLKRIHEVMQIATKTGIFAKTIAEWGAVQTDFDTLNNCAQLIKNAVKSKYEREDWLDVAGGLSDKIRENQKQALISYLLMQPKIQEWGAKDADSLFEYFLIDVQMGACMDSSRVVQANAGIQMFVNRCLMNLESDMSSGSEKGVSPGAIDKEHWEWMKNYRVWEANRKVFLYPENWLEPEWRNDRSEFFKELESYLVQNDITERSVEQAFRNYLTSLNEVANLEVCGMYQENDDHGKLKYLHVFARTHNTPYKFFYRKWDEFDIWSAWEKVQVDIRSVENGDDSGVHLIPVVWKKRLFLFWPEFIEKAEPAYDRSQSAETAAGNSMSELEPDKYWEIRLAFSEYVDGKWSPKQISKDLIVLKDTSTKNLKRVLCKSYIYYPTEELKISMWLRPCKIRDTEEINFWEGTFTLSDIQSEIMTQCGDETYDGVIPSTLDCDINFMKRHKLDEQLVLSDNTYLEDLKPYDLLNPNNFTKTLYDNILYHPFFFSDAYRTYFVRPVEIEPVEPIRDPENANVNNIPNMEQYDPDIWVTPDLKEVEIPFVNRASSDYMMSNSTQRPTTVATSGSAHKSASIPRAMTTRLNAMKYNIVGAAFGLDYIPDLRGGYGLEFHTFYHPFSSKFVTRLNQGGLPVLMGCDTEDPLDEIKSDDGVNFEEIYKPNFEKGLVLPKMEDECFKKRTYYKENVCFDVYGANSLYNWELFFHAPLYIATRLSKNGKYEEAMKWFHYIFDPTTDEMPEAGHETSRYWKVLPFKTEESISLEELFRQLNKETDPSSQDYDPGSKFSDVVSQWRKNPFDPHLVATNRPLAYMKHVVIKYVENLIAWGDSLFRQDTMESVNEALQIYVLANHILGPYPEFIPKRGEIKAESYYSLRNRWDDFSNALVELENIFPYSSEVSVSSTSTGTNLLGIGSSLYFCIPSNDRLLEYWDTVADRLFKIRQCQNIEGVERRLALFAPPISPEALIQAASQGLSLGSILADLSSPPPIYRFAYLIQKTNEFCAEVKGLGSALLAALEKKDGEELSRLRASHETSMLEHVTAIRERQVLDAMANKQNLLKGREIAAFRLQHYVDLLGNESVTVPAEPTIDAMLTADSQLPVDTTIETIETDVDESLVDSDESGVKLIQKEKEDLDKARMSMGWQQAATGMEGIAGALHFIPTVGVDGQPLGIGTDVKYGGPHFGAATSALAKIPQIISQVYSYQAAQAAKTAGFIRREQDWTLQANLAAKEIIQLDKQIISADIRIQVAEKELENHIQQIQNAKDVELFLKDKFTNQELYQWMKEQLFAVYKQSYNLAYDMAKKAEKAYNYELGTETASFIQYGYWDNSKEGLVSGEKLQLALRQLEKSYFEENRRELELTKSISLALLNPLALIELKGTGKCYVSLPEELFDLDFQGHYFRRIKSVSLSIPCIAGPYTTVNCSLRLLKNTIRVNTSMGDKGYVHNHDEGLWIDDHRFRANNVPVTSIATSTGQNDAGMFEFNFRDERYLPFEGAGAISDWQIELSTEKELRQFDYSTISDVILHLKFTARENGGLFKDNAVAYIKYFIKNPAELADQPFMRMFSLKHEFPTEWNRFINSIDDDLSIVNLSIVIKKDHFPFITQGSGINISKIQLFAIKDGELKDRNIAYTDIDILNDENNQYELAIAPDTEVLTHDKEAQVFLVLSYSLE